MTSYKPKLVIFDLDKTLANCNVSFRFGSYRYKKGQISSFAMLYLVGCYFLQKVGVLKITRLHHVSFQRFFLGNSLATFQLEVDHFLSEVKGLFRTSILQKLEEAKSTGAVVWLQSSSPECLVAPIARLLGIDRYTATCYAVNSDGYFSHVESIVDGYAKQKALNNYLQQENVNREEVVAYSDSMLDLPLLESVGCPVAVCPERALRKIAKMRAWQIIQV